MKTKCISRSLGWPYAGTWGCVSGSSSAVKAADRSRSIS